MYAHLGQVSQQLTANDIGSSQSPSTVSPTNYQQSPAQASVSPANNMAPTPIATAPTTMPMVYQQPMPSMVQMQQLQMQQLQQPISLQQPQIAQQPPQQMPPQVPLMQIPPQQISVQHQLQMQSQPPPMQMHMPQPIHHETLQLPSLNTALAPTFSREPVSAGYADTNSLSAPPLTHSHSFPNGHQLPSQLHGSSTSPSIVTSLGIGHPPHISSPLAAMPVSRPPSPKTYPIPDQAWFDAVQRGNGESSRTVSDSSTGLAPRRPSLQDRAASDSRADGRPIHRGRSSSVTRPQRGLTGMTSSVPPSAWNSRAVSPEDDDDEESEDEMPRKTKRRRSSAGNAPAESAALISEDMRRQLDRIFEEFLNMVCNDCKWILK